MVELKVRKFGNSLGVVLPKEVISRLQTADGEALFRIEAPDGGYQLMPDDPGFEKKMEKRRTSSAATATHCMSSPSEEARLDRRARRASTAQPPASTARWSWWFRRSRAAAIGIGPPSTAICLCRGL